MALNKSLNYSERRDFIKLLNTGGYVLDFSSSSFDAFTHEIVGIGLQEEYGLSKGKSLEAYLEKGPRSGALRLLEALLDEWSHTRSSHATTEEEELAGRCREQLASLRAGTLFESEHEHLELQGFTSEYLDAQRELLRQSVQDNPTTAIGIAKELVESCCATILQSRGVPFAKEDDLPKLLDKTTRSLGINPRGVPDEAPEPKIVKTLLGSLASAARSLAELRNAYGTGHGRPLSYSGLSQRHARLAAGTSLTLVQYLWDTHLERPHLYDAT